jgi:AcrR family transcriptional regulator
MGGRTQDDGDGPLPRAHGTGDEPAGARAERREQNRSHVERAALELFLERGPDGVTVEQISEAAGIAPATFYRYFGTKDGVLFAYQPAFLQGVRDAVAGVPAGSSRRETLRRALIEFTGFLDRQAESLGIRDEIVARYPDVASRTIAAQRQWEAALASSLAARRRLDEPDVAASLDAALGLAVIRLTFRRWRGTGAPSLSAVLPAVLDDTAAALGDL